MKGLIVHCAVSISMAVDYPLVLYDCNFEGLQWQSEPEEFGQVLATLQHHWTQTAVKTQVLHGMIQGLLNSGLSCLELATTVWKLLWLRSLIC